MSTPRRPEPRSSAAPITPIGRPVASRCAALPATAANTTEARPSRRRAPRPAVRGSATAPKGLERNADKAIDPVVAQRSTLPSGGAVTMIDPASIRTASFSLTPTGYNPEEVDRFLGELADADARLDRPGRAAQRILLPDPHRIQPGRGRSVPGLDRRPAGRRPGAAAGERVPDAASSPWSRTTSIGTSRSAEVEHPSPSRRGRAITSPRPRPGTEDEPEAEAERRASTEAEPSVYEPAGRGRARRDAGAPADAEHDGWHQPEAGRRAGRRSRSRRRLTEHARRAGSASRRWRACPRRSSPSAPTPTWAACPQPVDAAIAVARRLRPERASHRARGKRTRDRRHPRPSAAG